MARNFTLKQIYARGERLYKKLVPKLGPRSKGKILALEPESVGYVVGRNELGSVSEERKSGFRSPTPH